MIFTRNVDFLTVFYAHLGDSCVNNGRRARARKKRKKNHPFARCFRSRQPTFERRKGEIRKRNSLYLMNQEGDKAGEEANGTKVSQKTEQFAATESPAESDAVRYDKVVASHRSPFPFPSSICQYWPMRRDRKHFPSVASAGITDAIGRGQPKRRRAEAKRGERIAKNNSKRHQFDLRARRRRGPFAHSDIRLSAPSLARRRHGRPPSAPAQSHQAHQDVYLRCDYTVQCRGDGALSPNPISRFITPINRAFFFSTETDTAQYTSTNPIKPQCNNQLGAPWPAGSQRMAEKTSVLGRLQLVAS